MKKIMIFVIAAILVIGLISCTATESSDDATSQENSVTTPSTEQSSVDKTSDQSSETSSIKESSEERSSEVASSKETVKPTSSQSVSSKEEDNSRTVYRTPTGKRYHFDPDCGGKNSYVTTLNKAENSGLTPCKKCAQ